VQLEHVRFRGNWSYPTTIRFGAGRITEVGHGARALGMARPLIVSDAGLAHLPLFGAVLEACERAGLEVASPAGSDCRHPASMRCSAGSLRCAGRSAFPIGFPGFDDADAEEIGRRAAADVCTPTNPVPVDAEVLAGIYRDAVHGRVEALPLAS
jgi:alcohol dehydrogenase class IV